MTNRSLPNELPVILGQTPGETFIQLAQYNTPYPSDEKWSAALIERGWTHHPGIGLHLSIPHPQGPNLAGFCAHLDDVSSRPAQVQVDVRTDQDGTQWAHSGGRNVLGADDKAGFAVLLHMVQANVPGEYFLFFGEERGMIGSQKAASLGWGEHLEALVAFDRNGTSDVIEHQIGRRCVHRAFGEALAQALNAQGMNYQGNAYGSFTDSAAFISVIPQCTNLSVGYRHAHSSQEIQNLTHLNALTQACINIDWQTLCINDRTRRENSGGHGTRQRDGSTTHDHQRSWDMLGQDATSTEAKRDAWQGQERRHDLLNKEKTSQRSKANGFSSLWERLAQLLK